MSAMAFSLIYFQAHSTFLRHSPRKDFVFTNSRICFAGRHLLGEPCRGWTSGQSGDRSRDRCAAELLVQSASRTDPARNTAFQTWGRRWICSCTRGRRAIGSRGYQRSRPAQKNRVLPVRTENTWHQPMSDARAARRGSESCRRRSEKLYDSRSHVRTRSAIAACGNAGRLIEAVRARRTYDDIVREFPAPEISFGPAIGQP